MSATDVALWPFRQIRGWFGNVWLVLTTVSLRDLLPDWIISWLIFTRDSLPRSLGFTSSLPGHLTGVVVFTAALVISSAGFLTYVAIPYALFFGTIALLRLWPAVNQRWPFDESSWPLWEVR